jgi:alpha-L-fucosidase
MRYGLYYSGGIDWTFNPEPLRTMADFMGSTPGGDYPAYAEAQMRELIARYKPDILWNDISWPADQDAMLRLFADYYEAVPGGVINDRWMPMTPERAKLRDPEARRALDAVLKPRMQNARRRGVIPQLPPHCDFRTPEYAAFEEIQAKKWEATRGMSHSFGYNRRDADDDYESVESLVHGFIDGVARNGNLLLNVGPRGEDAQIPSEQIARLEGFGAWLKANGEGIYGTQPWTRAVGLTSDGGRLRFVQTNGVLYAHLLDTPQSLAIALEGADLSPFVRATHVATGATMPTQKTATGVAFTLPVPLAAAPAHAFRLSQRVL